MGDPTRLHAHEMAALLRAGETTSRQLTEAHVAAAERQNHALHAWLVIDSDGALAQADAADKTLAKARADVVNGPVRHGGGQPTSVAVRVEADLLLANAEADVVRLIGVGRDAEQLRVQRFRAGEVLDGHDEQADG